MEGKTRRVVCCVLFVGDPSFFEEFHTCLSQRRGAPRHFSAKHTSKRHRARKPAFRLRVVAGFWCTAWVRHWVVDVAAKIDVIFDHLFDCRLIVDLFFRPCFFVRGVVKTYILCQQCSPTLILKLCRYSYSCEKGFYRFQEMTRGFCNRAAHGPLMVLSSLE